ncbi:hypothetical protein SAMN02745181_0623 [Rubritalea squalenifaciens DSM 18772]|uniref:Uncharacterized protein n=1 Tax=Rubritalea squalenifaciens DSM 18772 TaxID=1123071 RepID=A0A1M6D1Z2_9BACT|nr:hypothetical protein [Rubritalea squalenifaciens]SHI67133.1 hypothetical protein SAMN02745181_0623 [Rubritalea squalenifaciens DSM 18772]
MMQEEEKGYMIVIDSLLGGVVPSVLGDHGPILFATEREAQEEIVSHLMFRLNEFLEGERDFESAVSLEEYVVVASLIRGNGEYDATQETQD